MGRLSKRTIQCRAARRSRDLKESLKASNKVPALVKSPNINTAINFNLLCEDSLMRYQHTYGLGLTSSSSREELVWAVQHHFKYQEVVDEGSLLCCFVQTLKKDSSSDSSMSSFS